MEKKIRGLVKALGSGWMFAATLLVFGVQAGWLAWTSRFPMAYDEAYHFGIIQFFAHRLNPIITSQPTDILRFGPLVHSPPFLYHYLLSWAYRFIHLFTGSMETQVICLRLINVALAIAGLVIARKLLRLIRVPDALANIVVLAVAFTPMMTVVSAQINYDNLLIPSVSLCAYETVLFIRQLNRGKFDTKRLLLLLCLCLFSSLIKFAFLPVFVAIAIVITWKISHQRHDYAKLMASARKSFAAMSKRVKLLLISACVLGGLLFAWFYLVNLVEYKTPVPQCTQALTVQACEHYPPWHYLHGLQQRDEAQPPYHMGAVQYGAWWLVANVLDLFSVQVPIAGTLSSSITYLVIVIGIGVAGLVCAIVNFRRIWRENPDFLIIIAISLIYLLCLLAMNYRDYLRVGQPAAIHGRYMLPVLVYVYVLLGSGLAYALKGKSLPALAAKTCLSLTVVLTFIYYGGFRQYIRYVDPIYGPLSPSNNFVMDDAST